MHAKVKCIILTNRILNNENFPLEYCRVTALKHKKYNHNFARKVRSAKHAIKINYHINYNTVFEFEKKCYLRNDTLL